MSDEEQRMTMGETCEELADLRRRLTCIRAKADKFRRQTTAATDVLSAVLGGAPFKKSPSESDWPSYSDIVALNSESLDTTKRITELENRLRDWKVIP